MRRKLAVFAKRPDIAGFGEKSNRDSEKLAPMNVPLDVLLRTAGVMAGLLIALVVALATGSRRRGGLVLLVGCAVAYLVCSAPARPCCSSPWTAPLLLGAAAFPFALWRIGRIVLEDDVSIAPGAGIGLAVLLAGALAAASDYLQVPAGARTAGAIANKLAALGFVGAALWGAWRSWSGDLVEPRRRLRGWLVGYLAAYGLVVLAGEIYLQGARPPAGLDLLNVLAIDATLVGTLLYLVQLRPAAMETLFAPQPAADPSPVAAAASPARDDPLLARLRVLMEEEALYRDPQLSVRSLAARVPVPEHVLRRLIHERLGHRNFAAYVNDFRLREVERRLLDPQWARRPILTLALEAGFGSIGPFNRAFRERFGMTPTEFRKPDAPQAPIGT